MNDLQTRQAIESSLHAFATRPLASAGVALLEALGYRSQKRLLLKPNTAEIFVNTFSEGKVLNAEQAILSDWQSVDVLFQLTDEEIRGGGNQQFLFESKGRYNGASALARSYQALLTKTDHRLSGREDRDGCRLV